MQTMRKVRQNLAEGEKNRPHIGKATISDVAALVGVSASTVSRVLNGGAAQELISEDTKRRVRDAAAQLGYRPNPIARALKGGQSHLIGLIVRAIADPFFAQVIQEITSYARLRGYQIVLGYIHSDSDEIIQMTSILDTRHIDGVIVLGELREDDEQVLATMLQHSPVVVELCRRQTPSSSVVIRTDNAHGTRLLFNHLVALGHTRIAFLDGSWLGDIEERRQTYLACMQEMGLSIRSSWIQVTNNDLRGGYEGMKRLLALPDPPTAVMAADDSMALGAIKAAHEAGWNVPGDISVVGFDDIDLAHYLTPGLTTVRQPVELLVAKTIDSVIGLITMDAEDAAMLMNRHERVLPQLVVRHSTMPPRP